MRTDGTLQPILLPVIGHSFVLQNVVVIRKLLRPVHQEPHELGEREFEHFVRVLLGLRVVFVPDPGDVPVLPVHELVKHRGEEAGNAWVEGPWNSLMLLSRPQ